MNSSDEESFEIIRALVLNFFPRNFKIIRVNKTNVLEANTGLLFYSVVCDMMLSVNESIEETFNDDLNDFPEKNTCKIESIN